MNKWMVTLMVVLFPVLGFSQSRQLVHKLSWQTLENIAFEKKFIKDLQASAMFPKFTDRLKHLEGTMVQINGFVIPLEPDASWVALSAYPNASCFFCGAAGPASVMTIRLKAGKHRYRIDEFLTFRGKLKLNVEDINEFYYILDEAVEIE